MEKVLFQDKTEKERLEMLDANADAVEQQTYMKSFDSETLQKKKDKLAETAIQITDLEQEIKDFKAEKDEDLKPLREERKQLIADIKAKGELVTEKVYKYVDIDNRMVGFYNSEGVLISERSAFQNELTPTIQSAIRIAK